jgi:multisubunit Na+/H+ antiporter MnhC subunit
LILTAIVIGFGVTAFLLALGYRMHALEEDEE